MDRLQEKNNLFVKLGALFGPLMRLAEYPDEYDYQERAATLARYFAEYGRLASEISKFCKGQPGHSYSIEESKAIDALHGVHSNLLVYGDLKKFEDIITGAFSQARDAIAAIPVPTTSVILEAGSPFTAYCRLRELCECDANVSVTWIDAFISSSVFNRYLSALGANVGVTLVTSEPGANAGRRDRDRWSDFLDISRLFSRERGQALYRLVVHPSLHDRWVVFDEKRIYSLGGSSKDAGDANYFTIAAVEASKANLDQIQAHIRSGVEYFGPQNANHQ